MSNKFFQTLTACIEVSKSSGEESSFRNCTKAVSSLSLVFKSILYKEWLSGVPVGVLGAFCERVGDAVLSTAAP